MASAPPSPLHRVPAWLWALALPAVAVLHAWLLRAAGPIDDEYILLRYARSWVEGEGLVFQPGERVEGFTAPLHLMLVAAGLWIGLQAEQVSLALGLCGAGLATWALVRCAAADRVSSRLPVAALALAVAPTFAWHGVAGLGTTLLAALLALWFLAALRGHLLLAGAWLALACLMRQECALFVPGFVWYLGSSGEQRSSGLLRGFAVLLPLASLVGWTLFRLAYYGEWLPVTYAVKKLPLLADLEYGVLYLGKATMEMGFLLIVLLGLLGWSRSATEQAGSSSGKHPGRAFSALLAGLLLHLAYVVYVGGDFVPWARFVQPVLPLWLLLAGRLASGLSRGASLLLTAAVLLLPQWVHLGIGRSSRQQLAFAHELFEERWLRLGEVLGEALPEGSRVGISPIGAFGWSSRLPLVDLLGLTNGVVRHAEPDLEGIRVKGHHRTDAEWALEQRPVVFVLGNGVVQQGGELAINPWERELFEHPRFQAEYEAVLVPVPGSAPLPCFRRRGWASPPGWQPLPR